MGVSQAARFAAQITLRMQGTISGYGGAAYS
jgi:hypothetical protein